MYFSNEVWHVCSSRVSVTGLSCELSMENVKSACTERATATAKATENNEGQEGEGKEAKLQWMKNQLGACNFENALGELSWLLIEWMTWLLGLLTADCWTADWWNDWLLHWQAGQSLEQQRSWWNSCSLIRKSRSNCKKIHRTMWDTILSSERYATNVATIQFY